MRNSDATQDVKEEKKGKVQRADRHRPEDVANGTSSGILCLTAGSTCRCPSPFPNHPSDPPFPPLFRTVLPSLPIPSFWGIPVPSPATLFHPVATHAPPTHTHSLFDPTAWKRVSFPVVNFSMKFRVPSSKLQNIMEGSGKSSHDLCKITSREPASRMKSFALWWPLWWAHVKDNSGGTTSS